MLNVQETPKDLEEDLEMNASLVPIGAPPKLDPIKDNNQNNEVHADSEDTEIYSEPDEQKTKETDSDLSPKGQLITREY